MSNSLKLFILIFATALALDFGRQIFLNKSSGADELIKYAEGEILLSAESLFDKNFINQLHSKSLQQDFLNTLNFKDQEFQSHYISVELYASDSLIYWSGPNTQSEFCQNLKRDQLTAKICLDLFNDRGDLHEAIYERSKLSKILKYNSSEYDSTLQERITSAGVHYSRRLNNFILLCYGLALALLIVSILKNSQYILFCIPIIIRVITIFFPSWELKFLNSDFYHLLFQTTAYSSIDLTIDMILFFGVLVAFTKQLFKKALLLNSRLYAIGHSVFLSLLITSHIRVVQLFINSSSFNLSISDLSQLNWHGVITIMALLIMQFAIFVYAVGFIQALKKQNPRNTIYQSLFISIALLSLLAYTLKLDLNIWLIIVFFIAFFILIDLFLDVKQKSITWIIWWAIFFGVYLSSLLFNYDIKKEINHRLEYIQSIYDESNYDRKEEDIKLLSEVSSSFRDILTLSQEEIYDINDLNSFLEEKHQNDQIVIDVINNQNTTSGYWQHPELFLTISDSLHIDPVKGILWHKSLKSDTLELCSGLKIKGLNRDSFPLAIIANGIQYSYNLETNTSVLNTLSKRTKKISSINSDIYIQHHFENKWLITRKSFDGLIKPIALFALLFSVIIVMILIIGFVNSHYRILPENWPLKFASIESLNSKIQVALIFVILLSFILIAILTSSFLKSYIDKRNKAFLDDKVESLSLDLKSKMALANSIPEGLAVLNNYKNVTEIIHNVGLEFTDLKSKSSDQYFPFAYFKKQDNPQAYSVQTNTQDWISYLPIHFHNNTVAYAKISHNNKELQKLNVFDFLGSIFNVYVFLFLLASVIAIVIARSITRPLSILNQKLTQLRLGKRNELISWEREDEIGELINNYNIMVEQLEDSAQILAKTERDSAWREMAKQVAHEIKNPLTPMKMYIQHLEKAVKQQPQNAVEISKKISSTLLEQVNNLTQIADSFSNFAELPQSKNEKIDLNKVVEVVHNLFRKRDDMDIRLSNPIDPVYVFADKNQLIRILNNLVKNATEAIPHDKRGQIHLHLYEKEDKALIKVSDNGIGVPVEMHTKIFQPKFTTKDSGSGLGLAIALNMIESMNGRLYFESESGIGTDFFIELDIIRQNYEDNKERITLD